MLSCPPATTSWASPAPIACAPRWIAFSPEPQTLSTLKAGTPIGNPPPIAACRAGFMPAPAVSTWPMIASSTMAGSTPLSARTCRMAAAPSTAGAELGESARRSGRLAYGGPRRCERGWSCGELREVLEQFQRAPGWRAPRHCGPAEPCVPRRAPPVRSACPIGCAAGRPPRSPWPAHGAGWRRCGWSSGS